MNNSTYSRKNLHLQNLLTATAEEVGTRAQPYRAGRASEPLQHPNLCKLEFVDIQASTNQGHKRACPVILRIAAAVKNYAPLPRLIIGAAVAAVAALWRCRRSYKTLSLSGRSCYCLDLSAYRQTLRKYSETKLLVCSLYPNLISRISRLSRKFSTLSMYSLGTEVGTQLELRRARNI